MSLCLLLHEVQRADLSLEQLDESGALRRVLVALTIAFSTWPVVSACRWFRKKTEYHATLRRTSLVVCYVGAINVVALMILTRWVWPEATYTLNSQYRPALQVSTSPGLVHVKYNAWPTGGSLNWRNGEPGMDPVSWSAVLWPSRRGIPLIWAANILAIWPMTQLWKRLPDRFDQLKISMAVVLASVMIALCLLAIYLLFPFIGPVGDDWWEIGFLLLPWCLAWGLLWHCLARRRAM